MVVRLGLTQAPEAEYGADEFLKTLLIQLNNQLLSKISNKRKLNNNS